MPIGTTHLLGVKRKNKIDRSLSKMPGEKPFSAGEVKWGKQATPTSKQTTINLLLALLLILSCFPTLHDRSGSKYAVIVVLAQQLAHQGCYTNGIRFVCCFWGLDQPDDDSLTECSAREW